MQKDPVRDDSTAQAGAITSGPSLNGLTNTRRYRRGMDRSSIGGYRRFPGSVTERSTLLAPIPARFHRKLAFGYWAAAVVIGMMCWAVLLKLG